MILKMVDFQSYSLTDYVVVLLKYEHHVIFALHYCIWLFINSMYLNRPKNIALFNKSDYFNLRFLKV